MNQDIRINPKNEDELRRTLNQIVTEIGANSSSSVIGIADGYKLARGQQTMGSSSDTVVTGLTTVVSAVANLENAPDLSVAWATAHIGDQAGSPAAGSIYIKIWVPTSSGDTTPQSGTAAGEKVNWIAIGTG